MQAAPKGEGAIPLGELLWFSSHGGWGMGLVMGVVQKLASKHFEVLARWKSLEFLVMERVLHMVQLEAFTVNLRTGEMADPYIEQQLLAVAGRLALSRKSDPSLGFPGAEVTEYTDDEKTQQLISMALKERECECAPMDL